MNEEEIAAAIGTTVGIDDLEHRTQAVRATLHTLAQRLAGGETGQIAAHLPDIFAETLAGSPTGDRFTVSSFYKRVADAEGFGCNAYQARWHAQAVMAVVKLALSDSEYAALTAQLPDDYDDLLSPRPAG